MLLLQRFIGPAVILIAILLSWYEFDGRYLMTAIFAGAILGFFCSWLLAVIAGLDAIEKKLDRQ